ncbi:MAG: glycosyltransferase family 39 protein [Candidatus Doudnabacteria bacterium]|nr:glycosyltransferase family 39 protein [Candidatus Doudnabacteria bacterium]
MHEKSNASKAASTQLYDLIFLSLLMILATAISAYFLLHQSIRLDESQSLWQSSRSLKGLIKTISQDVHMPLYSVLLHLWQRLVGNSIETARIPSLFFFLLSIPALYSLGKQAFQKNIARFACLLFSLSPFISWYGNETRMYSLLTLLTILNQISFLKLISSLQNNQNHRILWAYFSLTTILGIYTHYFFWLVLTTQFFYLLLTHKNLLKKYFNTFILMLGIILCSFVPWVLQVLKVGFFSNTTPLINLPTYLNLFNSFTQFIFGFQAEKINTIILSLWPITVLMLFFYLQKNNRLDKNALYFLLTAFLPPLLIFLISITIRPIFVTRYFIFTVPSLFLFLSWLIYAYSKTVSYLLKTTFVSAMICTLYLQNVLPNAPIKENYRAAASYLSSQSSNQDLIAISAPFTIYPIEYYYQGPAKLVTIPSWNRYEIGPVPEFSLENLNSESKNFEKVYQKVWLVLSYDQGEEAEIKKYFDEKYHKVDELVISNGLRLYAYKLRYDPPVSIQ